MAAAPDQSSRLKNLASRVMSFLVAALFVSLLQINVSKWVHQGDAPAGLAAGVVDGILMPMAMPALIVGKDMTIYAPNNTGRTYKLGYTLGVNGCGAVFFGVVFLRLARWRKARRDPKTDTP